MVKEYYSKMVVLKKSLLLKIIFQSTKLSYIKIQSTLKYALIYIYKGFTTYNFRDPNN